MKIKNFSAFFWSVSTVLVLALPIMAQAASFQDVPENTVHYNAVEYLKAEGVVGGYSDGTFQPDKTINRAEALKIILLASGLSGESTTVIDFPDVHPKDWFYGYVQRGVERDIVKGYDDGNFKPANNINVAESLKIILLSFAMDLPASVLSDPYPDVSKTVWYANYAEYSRAKQIIWTQDDGNLDAGRDITRGEFAQIIYRLMYIKEKNLEVFPLSTDWPMYTHPTEHYSLKFPFNWQRVDAGQHTVFWKQDTENNQINFARVFANGATVVVSLDLNPDRLDLKTFVDQHNPFTNSVTQTFTLNDYPLSIVSLPDDKSMVDYFFEMPDKTILIAYVEVGDGANRPQLLEEIRNIIGSVRFSESATGVLTERDQVLAKVREYILVQGQGQAALDQFDDELIIETDTIGIGTGPVDYYYSTEFDVTLKYERTSATLLALSNGKNTAF